MPEQQDPEFTSALRDSASQLINQLDQGNFGDALRTIHDINLAREQSLFQEVGKLTRALHDAIVNFHIDMAAKGGQGEQGSELADASDRLNYVIEMTEKAANRTMDLVDECTPVAEQLGEEARTLRSDWQRLIKRELSAEEFRDLYKRMDGFLDYTEKQAGELHSGLSNIIMAQEYQDLTGQLIKRVIGLVKDVESSLVNLVRMAGQVEAITGIKAPEGESAEAAEKKAKERSSAGEGPQIHPENRPDVVSGQDDVDDLLSSLGF